MWYVVANGSRLVCQERGGRVIRVLLKNCKWHPQMGGVPHDRGPTFLLVGTLVRVSLGTLHRHHAIGIILSTPDQSGAQILRMRSTPAAREAYWRYVRLACVSSDTDCGMIGARGHRSTPRPGAAAAASPACLCRDRAPSCCGSRRIARCRADCSVCQSSARIPADRGGHPAAETMIRHSFAHRPQIAQLCLAGSASKGSLLDAVPPPRGTPSRVHWMASA